MGLGAGAVLRIQKEGQKIVLQPVQGEPQVMEKKGILVFTGAAVGDISVAVHELRKRRLKKMTGSV
jgi:hypothetical protein